MEVIYGGLHLTAEEIAAMAVQEAVDVVGISSLSDAHMIQAPRIIGALKERDGADIPVILGGFIQPEDIPLLKEKGVKEVFGIGTRMDVIIRFIQELVCGLTHIGITNEP